MKKTAKRRKALKKTEIYVSTYGNDNAAGTKAEPLRTPEKAVEAVRKLLAEGTDKPIDVIFDKGEYKVKNLSFTEADSGTKATPVTYKSAKNGEVIFNGGTTLNNKDFKPVTDKKILARLAENVRDKVKVIDLKPYGITLADIGPIYESGTGGAASKYDGDVIGNNCEIFWNNKRLTNARYPNDCYSYVEEVTDRGENPGTVSNWKDIRNPRGGTIVVDADAKAHIAKWKEPEKAWVFGRFYWEWADMSTPVSKINVKTGEVTLAHVSSFDYRAGGSFYFFNVLEELDKEGEYYIDRDNMLVYVYPPEDEKDLEASISVTDKPILSGKNVNYLTFDGLTMKGTRSDIANFTGDHLTFKNCLFSSAYSWALLIKGYYATVDSCEMCHLGRGGVMVNSGVIATMEPGHSIVKNCYVHHFEQVYRTYQQGINLNGCENKAIHNEVCFAPHLAVSYHGVNHLIAYNYIHDVVTESSDSGALYVGGSWTSPGNVIKFNRFENIGEGKYTPQAIYFDDGMSGQACFGNLIINCKGAAFLLGGGRELNVHNNLMINVGTSIFYDDRFSYDGYDPIINHKPGTGLWTTLDRVPYRSKMWADKFPILASLTEDFNDYKSLDFPANPAYSVVQYNVECGKKFKIAQSKNIHLFSFIIDNYHCSEKDISKDGKFKLSESFIIKHGLPWIDIPVDEIGRYKK